MMNRKIQMGNKLAGTPTGIRPPSAIDMATHQRKIRDAANQPPRYPLLSLDQLASLGFVSRRTLQLQLQRDPLTPEEVAANLAHARREGWLK
jgi:hypothetical protein